ncbi:porin [Henriciella sp. AS95]|uniref:porin n=1 Tax=Henriciella sp. AS95 TaxID=3135782 RepID=UPI00316B80BF
MFKISMIVAVSASLPVLPALAQSSPLEYKSSLEAVTVIAPGQDTDRATDTEELLYEFSLDNRVEKVLSNGAQISGRLTLRGQRDHPLRPGFDGAFGGAPGPAGAYSGLSGGLPGDETGARGSLEAAYIEVDGGYGEVRLGRDRGVAARFHEGAPSALTHARLDSPYLDPNGLKIIRTNHDLTGPSAKISYATPRILGLRAAASYTPDADARGLDRNVSSSFGQPDLENAFEFAANLSRRLRSPDLRIDASLGWSTAEVGSAVGAPKDSVETWSVGTQLEFPLLTVGGSWLSSDNGFQGGDYTAWEIGTGFEWSETDISLNYGEAEDELAVLSSEAISLAAARDITDSLRLALAYQDETLETAAGNRSGAGFVVEITLSSDFLEITTN